MNTLLGVLLAQAAAESLVQDILEHTDGTPEAAVDVMVDTAPLRLTPGTQQMLYTLEAMIQVNQGMAGYKDALMTSYIRWMLSQVGPDVLSKSSAVGLCMNPIVGQVLEHHGAHLDAMMQVQRSLCLEVNQNRHPLAVARMIPLMEMGLTKSRDIVQSIALYSVRLTDGHEEMETVVEALFDIVFPILKGGRVPSTPFTLQAGQQDPTRLGSSRTAKAAFQRALWCVKHADDYTEAVIHASQQPNTQMSVAGLTGALWSLMHGEGAPAWQAKRLECGPAILALYASYRHSLTLSVKKLA